MHTTIHYEQKTDAEKREAALRDVAEWLDVDVNKMRVLAALVVTCTKHEELDGSVRFIFSFAGIQGYPVDAFFAMVKEM